MTFIRFTPVRKIQTPVPALGAGELARLVDGLFGGGYHAGRFKTEAVAEPVRAGRLSFAESAAAYTLALQTPGFSRESVKVEIEGEVLTLSGSVPSGESAHVSFDREFTRRVRLPGPVAAEGHKAEVKDGILTVTLAKPAPRSAEPVRIAIN